MSLRIPNPKSLRMFDAAARHLNFRHAAEELSLTQGAVAQQVRQLEADLDVKLFIRLPRGLALTEAGASYFKDIGRALALIDEATRNIAPDATRITLSVTPSFASKWLVPRLASFTRQQPDIELHTLASEEVANFHSDGVHLAVRMGTPPFGTGLHVNFLSRLDLCAVTSPDYAEKTGTVSRLEDFSALHLIQDAHKSWETLFDDAGMRVPGRMLVFNQTALALDAAESGQGIALAPKLLLGEQLLEGRLVALWEPQQEEDDYGYYLVYPAGPKWPERDKIVSWLVAEAGKECA